MLKSHPRFVGGEVGHPSNTAYTHHIHTQAMDVDSYSTQYLGRHALRHKHGLIRSIQLRHRAVQQTSSSLTLQNDCYITLAGFFASASTSGSFLRQT